MRDLLGVNLFMHQRRTCGNTRMQRGRRLLQARVKVAHFTVLNARGLLKLSGALRLLEFGVLAVHFQLARLDGVQIFFLQFPLRGQFAILILQTSQLAFDCVKAFAAVGIFFQFQRLALNF